MPAPPSLTMAVSGPGTADVQAAFAATVVDELARSGVTHAVVCPGSRSAPLALALAAHPGVAVHVRLDERSAGFTALGIGLVTGRPAVVLTTSGTAAVELHAAVVEADRARVAVIVCTADRPPELHDVGADQTIDQTRLFGGAVRWFGDPGVPEPGGRGMWRSLAARLVAASTAGPDGPGPVHLNLPFREPLIGEAGRAGGPSPGRAGGEPWHAVTAGRRQPPEGWVADLVERGWAKAARGLVVAGGGTGGIADPGAVLELSEALGWPILADPRSGLRSANEAAVVVAAADGILRSGRFAEAHRPDSVLHLGDRWLSRSVGEFLGRAAAAGARSVAVDPHGRWSDPARHVGTNLAADPTAFCTALVAGVAGDAGVAGVGGDGGPGPARDGERRRWQEDWRRAESQAQRALDVVLGTGSGRPPVPLTEPSLARRLVAAVPGGSSLVVSASRPVRDVEAYGACRPDPPRVLVNRGVNGIDGVVSTALGVALAGPGPTVALVGDLAFLHDVSALVRAEGFAPDLTVVVADNAGGGIFSFLEVASRLGPAQFDELFATPQSTDVAEVAAGFGWPVDDLGSERRSAGLEETLARHLARPGPSVIRVRLPARADNVVVHRDVDRAVVAAVEAGGGRGQQGRGS